jgi:hypothetical protein
MRTGHIGPRKLFNPEISGSPAGCGLSSSVDEQATLAGKACKDSIDASKFL